MKKLCTLLRLKEVKKEQLFWNKEIVEEFG
jgi:hypothetical protein